jgi:hypothetical protein
MHWNHRVVEFDDTGDGNGKHWEVCEVYYNNDGTPMGYTEAKVRWYEVDGPNGRYELMERINKAMAQPIIKRSDFPDGGKEPAPVSQEDCYCGGWVEVSDGTREGFHEAGCPEEKN